MTTKEENFEPEMSGYEASSEEGETSETPQKLKEPAYFSRTADSRDAGEGEVSSFHACKDHNYSGGGGAGGATDDPPIGGGGGSFFLDIPKIITLTLGIPTGFYTPQTIYRRLDIRTEKNVYRGIGMVKVLTEEPNGDVTYQCYDTSPDDDPALLKIWLTTARRTDPPTKDTTPTNVPPDIIIDGRNKGAIFSKIDFLREDHEYKGARPIRLKYQSPNQSLLRVKKWQVVRASQDAADTTGVGIFGENRDLFYLYIYFSHPE